MFKRLLIKMVVLASIGAVSLGYLYSNLSAWGEATQPVNKASNIHFPKGTRLDELAGSLEASGVIDDALKFKLWVKLKGHYHKYQAGLYRFSGKVSPSLVDYKMTKGKTFTPIALQFVIPEGFTLKQTINRLVANRVGSYDELWKLAHNKKFLAKLKVKAPNLEGYIYPATYKFLKRLNGKEVFSEMVETFWEKLPPNYLERIKAKRLSLHKAITFASLIEMETSHEDEKNMIAEVIWSRLKNREPLGIDAALIYGIENYKGDIKWKHLKDRKNKYNTRIHKGLPPGPIGAVTSSTLESLLNPTSKGYYYYVLIAGTTRHHFSKTFKEHNKHVKLLLKQQRR